MSESSRVNDLLLRWEELKEAGREPTPEALCADHPELVDDVRRGVAQLRQMARRLDATARPADVAQAVPLAEEVPSTVTAGDSKATHSFPPGGPRPARVSVLGYDIVGELGRGGMGVVYKAYHGSLKRTVALKTILSGGQAAESELARFRVEAEAAARLQHPNIVQIYEVGTYESGHGPCPYMALEFLEGGSLARRVAGGILLLREGAELVAVLARAMDHAHQRGVIHRDLKPANVLFTADGTPKVTDFGLAKKLEGDSLRTATGAVMGTPCYMAPEQAEGRIRDIGPQSDVYALGAILYELIAGRPPFAGGSVVETLERVRTKDPVPPSRIRSRVPRDLETVCLKCLRKEPAQRYASARELAEDLDRFRAGEAVLARREPSLNKLVRRVRRHPGRSAAIIGTVLLLAGALGLIGRYRADNQVAELRREARDGIEALDGGDDRLAQLEGVVARLDRLDPAAAAAERERLAARLTQLVAADIGASSLDGREEARLRAAVERVAVRSPERADELRAALAGRLRDWHKVLSASAPFGDAATPFSRTGVSADGDRRSGPADGPRPDVVGLKEVAAGNVAVTAAYAAAGWGATRRIGVALNTTDACEGYAFVLTLPEAAPASRGPRTLEQACAVKAALRLQILRCGQLLREEEVPSADLAGEPVRFRGERAGPVLSFQFNDRAPFSFHDPFPLGTRAPGVFALVWPAGTRLTAVEAFRQSSSAPRPLEVGDDLFGRAQYETAADYYHREAVAAGDTPAAQEAWYKEGRCWLERNQFGRATECFEKLGVGGQTQWQALADCQLWLILLARQDEASVVRAREVRDRLAARGLSFEQLAALLPFDLRSRLLRGHQVPASRMALLTPGAGLIDRLRDAAAVERLLDPGGNGANVAIFNLVKAYRLAGQEEEALTAAREFLRDHPVLDSSDMTRQVLLQLAWILQTRGPAGAAEALKELDRYLAPGREAESPYRLMVLPDRARVLAALGEWAAAEADVDRCIGEWGRQAGVPVLLADAYFVKGFLREHAGDTTGARAAWKSGADAFKKVVAANPESWALTEWLEFVAMASLADCLDDADAREARRRFVSAFGGEGALKPIIDRVVDGQPVDVYRRMWRTKRGTDIARRMALHQVSLAEFSKLPLLQNAATTIHSLTLAGEPSPDQDELIWQFVGNMFAAFSTGQLSAFDLLGIGLPFFKADTPATPAVLPKQAGLRGPLAYLFGLRYRFKGILPEAAKPFFDEAKTCAAANPLLERLLAKEQERPPSEGRKQ